MFDETTTTQDPETAIATSTADEATAAPSLSPEAEEKPVEDFAAAQFLEQVSGASRGVRHVVGVNTLLEPRGCFGHDPELLAAAANYARSM